MGELNELYQAIILDHNKRPRHSGVLEETTHQADGYNPTCGDKVVVFLRVVDGRINAITFESASCAICRASASMMCCALVGADLKEVRAWIERIEDLFAGHVEASVFPEGSDLRALAGVKQFPARVKCASLSWQALTKALGGEI
jgi:SUF system FeS assembly protein, NifU family